MRYRPRLMARLTGDLGRVAAIARRYARLSGFDPDDAEQDALVAWLTSPRVRAAAGTAGHARMTIRGEVWKGQHRRRPAGTRHLIPGRRLSDRTTRLVPGQVEAGEDAWSDRTGDEATSRAAITAELAGMEPSRAFAFEARAAGWQVAEIAAALGVTRGVVARWHVGEDPKDGFNTRLSTARRLVAGGMGVMPACRQAGISPSAFNKRTARDRT